MKRFVITGLLLFASVAVPAKGEDPLETKVTLTQGYNTFDEAVARLEKATGWRISCPADTAKVMLAIWKREQFPSRTQDDFFLKTPRAVKEVLDSVCEDLGLTWKHREADQTVLIDVLAVRPLTNYSEPRSVHFVMEDDGSKVVDSSGAGESLLKPAK